MASSRELISSQVLGTAVNIVTFSSIPQTYKDLCLRWSAKDSFSLDSAAGFISINTRSAPYQHSDTIIQSDPGTGTPVSSSRNTGNNTWYFAYPGSNYSNNFGSAELYIPNYANGSYKAGSVFSVSEANTSTLSPSIMADAGLVSNTAAVTSIIIKASWGDFVANSSFYLYGIKSS